MRFQVDNGGASEKPTAAAAAENSKESCAPTTSENAPIEGDAVSPSDAEAAPVAAPIAEGACFSIALCKSLFLRSWVSICRVL